MELTVTLDPQEQIIYSTEGIYLIDAGAGTGKTYAIIQRYRNLIREKTRPENILLITYTINAANQMREEVLEKVSDVNITELLEAPIMTFHAFCSLIIKKHGMNSPSYLGLRENLTAKFQIIEDIVLEKEIFKKFFSEFANSQKEKYVTVINSLEINAAEVVLNIIKKLCSVGIFPHLKGWSKENFKKLKGNYDKYSELFDEKNETTIGKRGNEVQNILQKSFNSENSGKLYLNYDKNLVKDESRINPEIKEEAFNDETQDELINFIGEVYTGYVSYLIKRNLMNFDFMIMFAYLILLNNKNAREKNQFDYVMIDEFQDTDETQFRLIMLLCKNHDGQANLCVVGDWKQGIYGFRNAQIENIINFSDNLELFKAELNSDETRIHYDIQNVTRIRFEHNYRSSKEILNFSHRTLFISAGDKDKIDADLIIRNFKSPLLPRRELDDLTGIGFYEASGPEEEIEIILKKISELVNEKDKYKIRVFNKDNSEFEDRSVQYKDICVLTRKKKFGLELQREAIRNRIPVNFGGGMEIFLTEQGILVLAWLRLLLNDKDLKAWLPVFDKEGYSFSQERHLCGSIRQGGNAELQLFNELPKGLEDFLNHLRQIKENTIYVVEAILNKYSFRDEWGNKLLTIISNWLKADMISINELVMLIENSKLSEFEIEINKTADAVLVQTIHASKGLEYPVIILANCNERNFPDKKGDSNQIIYSPVTGLRSKKIFASNGKYFYNFDNWKTDLLYTLIKKTDYDEERRLLYVAVTRAKQYLYFTAHKPTAFFSKLQQETGKSYSSGFSYDLMPGYEQESMKQTEIIIDSPERSVKFASPHSVMDQVIFEHTIYSKSKEFSEEKIKSKEFGIFIHKIAHRIANGIEVESELDEVRIIKQFITDLKADEIKSEVDFLFPKENQIFRGTIDLLAFYDKKIEVIDYKTDANKNNLEKYKVQINIYKDFIGSIYKNHEVIGKIFFVRLNQIEFV